MIFNDGPLVQFTTPCCGVTIRRPQYPIKCKCTNVEDGHNIRAIREQQKRPRFTQCRFLGEQTGEKVQSGCRSCGTEDVHVCLKHDTTCSKNPTTKAPSSSHRSCLVCFDDSDGWEPKPQDDRAPIVYPYITTRRLIDLAIGLAARLPSKCTVVGCARSGLIPASVIATHNHCELFAIDIRQKRITNVGNGIRFDRQKRTGPIILVDDSIWSGHAMSVAERVIRSEFPSLEIIKVAAIVREKVAGVMHGDIVPLHYFEWNLANAPFSKHVVFDFDGILCPDFTAEEDDDGEVYVERMRQMEQTHIRPHKFPIKIITARLEKYREPTMRWLEENGYEVGELIMGPWETKADRERDSVSKWKGIEFLNRPHLHHFVESDPQQARMIWDVSRKAVCCPTSQEVFI